MIRILKAVLPVLLILALAGCASSGTPVLERYSAFGVSMGATATGARAPIQIGIERWTTEDERVALVNTLVSGGHEALQKALFDSEQAGFVKVSGSMGYPLRYAWSSQVDGKRRIVLATERAVRYPGRNTRLEDYDLSFIELLVDGEGKGEGAFAVGAKLGYDKEKSQIVIENYSTEPVRLLDVKLEK